jgi:hypothetical protein
VWRSKRTKRAPRVGNDRQNPPRRTGRAGLHSIDPNDFSKRKPRRGSGDGALGGVQPSTGALGAWWDGRTPCQRPHVCDGSRLKPRDSDPVRSPDGRAARPDTLRLASASEPWERELAPHQTKRAQPPMLLKVTPCPVRSTRGDSVRGPDSQ